MKTYKHSAEARAKNTARHKAWRLKNVGLGSFRESAAIVAKAAMYLAYHESRRRESA